MAGNKGGNPNLRKGLSANPSGLKTHVKHARAILELEAVKSIRVIRDIRDNEELEPAVRLAAAKDILDRAIGKAKQQTELSVNVATPQQAHVDALKALTNMAASAANIMHNQSDKPLILLDNPASTDKLTLNQQPIIDVEAVELSPDNAADSTAERPPAPPPGRVRQ